MRRALKFIGVSFLVGALSLGAAWAGAGLTSAPVDLGAEPATGSAAGVKAATIKPLRTKMAAGDSAATVTPKPGEVLAGAAKIDIYPQPPEGSTWERDPEKCDTQSPQSGKFDYATHIAHTGSPWPENPNCIYSGGFGIGPANGLTEYDAEHGLWVRTFAVKGSNGKTFTGTIIDGEGYFWDYKSKCGTPDDCGIKQIAAQMAELHADAGLSEDGVMIASTHSHAAPDFIGGWGFVPDWYMDQVTQAIRDSISQSISSMKPARLEIGEELARRFNSERRDTYRSAEEQQLTWIRAVATEGSSTPESKTIFTAGAFAAHPTSKGSGPMAYADWPVTFAKAVEARFGGVGMAFQTGLGNMSSSMGGDGTGLGQLVPAVGKGLTLSNTEVKYGRTLWAQPTTNVPLTALGTPGFFDREFLASPAQVRTGKSPDTAPCVSGSPSSVELNVQGLRIGDQFALSAAPGEVFSNLTNTVKEKSGALVTMPIAQANDALGYMPQSFELHPVGQQGLGFVAGGFVFVNYEDAYSIDRCVGDAVLENTIALLDTLKG